MRRIHPAHPATAAAGAGLDQHGIADRRRLGRQARVGFVVPVVARHAGDSGRARDALGLDLRAHALDAGCGWADPGQAVLGAEQRQHGALRQEAVAWMDRVRPALPGGGEDGGRVEIAARRFGRADAHGRVGGACAVRPRPRRNRRRRWHAHAAAGADDAAGDLAAIGDQDLAHRYILYTGARPVARGSLAASARHRPITSRVCSGSIMPSSQSRAEA